MQESKITPRFIMVTGGQRCGKSVFAEQLALRISAHPAYLATARVMDEEMARRVEIHKDRRKNLWRNLETPLEVAACIPDDCDVVLIDCLTLLATNWFFEKNESVEDAYNALKEQIESLRSKHAIFIIVTNEVGLGGVSPNTMQRKFADLQGAINQYVASISTEVYLIISGIPVKIKDGSHD